MKFTELPQKLKQNINSIYLLKGNDDFIIQSAIKHISNACGNEFPDFNKVYINDENFNIHKVKDACLTAPLGNDRKFILIKDVFKITEAEKTTLLEILSNLPQTTTITILYNDSWKFLKECDIVDCDSINIDLISKFVKAEVMKAKKQISNEAIGVFISQCNNNITKISNELKKLIYYCDYEVEIEDINKIVEKDFEYQVFELSENLGKKKSCESIKILTTFIDKKEPLQPLFSLICNHFRRIIYSGLSDLPLSELSSIFGVKQYAMLMAKEHSKLFSKAQLKNILEALEETDNMIKTGKMSIENGIFYLAFKILYC